jgi:hypothetical protein
MKPRCIIRMEIYGDVSRQSSKRVVDVGVDAVRAIEDEVRP